uniref:Uncharacterized protein n=1 Tax=Aureoumbra lagunensis TaxID=44058 RepID=A0A7S3JYA8_9STRA|mmetsp:Transcript_18712/g.28215  ORF Transcript_18712/g.28215 Transcript_18712/m.28215 type:complete len:355 (+) Transcript_18712:85-1149(+)|eukprot:CAMPEP_0197293276 /NCGR_PEP_ID=MMETSP0890-20130614/27660_1 /TAXON_ID=44058 ORGANISM="Aureoumbra lagunensis, Strain CCMP1510" /NCGR_SAMPLE_ID=MMETSP0890 /ASSEMBLY_ACC=CAM_ASM_000533 /LENGTH=354 /DNA_ID=CAMNT_0042767871 /DNA_START=63 /DNA_END=1127 /DNA_ORIENTATION=+
MANTLAKCQTQIEQGIESLLRTRPDNCIFVACWRGDLEKVRYGLKMEPNQKEINPNEIELSKESGLTLLHVASYFGHESIVSMLLERGAREARAGVLLKWWTCLHMACIRGHANVVRILNSSWSVIQRRDVYNRTPLHLAAFVGNMEALFIMLRKAPDNLARCQLLDSQGYVAKDDYFGDTPLDEACSGKQWKTVRFLLQQGATLLHTDRCMNDLVANGTVVLGADLLKTVNADAINSDNEHSYIGHMIDTTLSSSSIVSSGSDVPGTIDRGVKFRRLYQNDMPTSTSTTRITVPPPPSNALAATESNDFDSSRRSSENADDDWQTKFENLAKLAINSGIDSRKVDDIRHSRNS